MSNKFNNSLNNASAATATVEPPKTVKDGRKLMYEKLLTIDDLQARRFAKLQGESLTIAAEGITRHLRACARMDVHPDMSAVREIIDDSLNGKRVFAMEV